jgi:hypothetical protein
MVIAPPFFTVRNELGAFAPNGHNERDTLFIIAARRCILRRINDPYRNL